MVDPSDGTRINDGDRGNGRCTLLIGAPSTAQRVFQRNAAAAAGRRRPVYSRSPPSSGRSALEPTPARKAALSNTADAGIRRGKSSHQRPLLFGAYWPYRPIGVSQGSKRLPILVVRRRPMQLVAFVAKQSKTRQRSKMYGQNAVWRVYQAETNAKEVTCRKIRFGL